MWVALGIIAALIAVGIGFVVLCCCILSSRISQREEQGR